MSRQTIGSSAVIGVPDGDNPVQPIRPSRIGGKGRLIAKYADLIGAENLFAEYQCGLAAARGPRVLVLGVDPAAIPRPVPAPGTGEKQHPSSSASQRRAASIGIDRGASLRHERLEIGAQARRASLTDVSLTGSA